MTQGKPSRRVSAADMTFAGATPPHREHERAVVPAAPAPTTPPDVSETPDPTSQLASLLAGSGETDTPRNGHHGMSIPLAALMAPPKVDPDLDLVQAGVSIPRYLDEALRATAFLTRRHKQRIVADALKAHLRAELVDEAYRTAAGGDAR
jgi:hypothetical protein